METRHSKTVHLSLSLFSNTILFIQACMQGMLRRDNPAYLTTSIIKLKLPFLLPHSFTIHTVVPTLSHTNTDLIHLGMFTSWRQQKRPKAASEIRALSLFLSLNIHCLHTTDSAQFVCAVFCEGSSSSVS